MIAERWRHIEGLLQEALARSAAERAGYLDAACSGDLSLRRELESLLRHEAQACSFLESNASSVSAPATRELVPAGERIGPYTVLELLGSGGMGDVYKAHDQRLDRHLAMKFLPLMTGDGASFRRFEQEARSASALNHPNICTVHDVGEHGGRPFLVMELLEGQSLKQRIAQKPVEPVEFIAIALQVCTGLQAAHDKGIIHRDIKPANIFVTEDGTVKVLDFGLAKRGVEVPHQTSPFSARDGSATVTLPGKIAGTLAYMSPEQALGEDVDLSSDIFSLGIVLYEMATGKPAFTGKSAVTLLASILTEPPAKPSFVNPRLPASLDRIICKALEKEPGNRYASVAELAADLAAWSDRGRSFHLAWVAAAFAVIAIALGAAVAYRLGWFSPPSRSDLTPRQVTANPPEDPVMQAALSPDGSIVAYGDFAGIHLRRIGGGEIQLIAPPKDYCFR